MDLNLQDSSGLRCVAFHVTEMCNSALSIAIPSPALSFGLPVCCYFKLYISFSYKSSPGASSWCRSGNGLGIAKV